MVQVTMNKEGNGVVTAYPNNPQFGYVKLQSIETVFQNGWLKKKQRSTLMRGETEMLTEMFTAGQTMPGRITVTECTEDNIPAAQLTQLDKNKDFEEQIAPFLKRAGSDDAPLLMSEGKRILRFTEYDDSGKSTDTRIAHDNGADVKAYNAAKTSSDAQLPS